ncbi:MAG: MarC family protein [Polyangiaceae bacterium]
MPTFTAYTILCFGSLFSIVDPFAALPVFLALVGGHPKADQAKTAAQASLTCLAVLTSFSLAGSVIFNFFSISIPAFKLAGGILLFGVGLEMMRAKQSDTRTTKEERHEAETKEEVGVIPLGLPLLSGPGSIATVMVLTGKAKTIEQRMSVHVAIIAVSLIAFLVLRSATYVARALGRTGINLIGRIMGLILAATAMQFVIDGAREAFPKLLQ